MMILVTAEERVQGSGPEGTGSCGGSAFVMYCTHCIQCQASPDLGSLGAVGEEFLKDSDFQSFFLTSERTEFLFLLNNKNLFCKSNNHFQTYPLCKSKCLGIRIF